MTTRAVQPVELQWSHWWSNDLANHRSDCQHGDCVWPHLPWQLLPPGDMRWPGRDLTSSQSDKLWWVFQSKHNWWTLLTSNLYSARVHLTRHCHRRPLRPHRTFLHSSGPFHYLRQQTQEEPGADISQTEMGILNTENQSYLWFEDIYKDYIGPTTTTSSSSKPWSISF